MLPHSDRAGSSFPRTYWQLPPCLPKWEGCGCFPASPGVLEFQKKKNSFYLVKECLLSTLIFPLGVSHWQKEKLGSSAVGDVGGPA